MIVPAFPRRLCVILLVCCAAMPSAAEDLVAGGKTYKSYKVTKVEADGLRIMHADGMAKIPFEQLSKELQEAHGYDPAKAAAAREKSEAAQAKAQEALRKAREAKVEKQKSEIQSQMDREKKEVEEVVITKERVKAAWIAKMKSQLGRKTERLYQRKLEKMNLVVAFIKSGQLDPEAAIEAEEYNLRVAEKAGDEKKIKETKERLARAEKHKLTRIDSSRRITLERPKFFAQIHLLTPMTDEERLLQRFRD